jgi:hypothetical protein
MDYDEKLNEIIQDRILTPTKLISLCQQYDSMNVVDFFDNILTKHF